MYFLLICCLLLSLSSCDVPPPGFSPNVGLLFLDAPPIPPRLNKKIQSYLKENVQNTPYSPLNNSFSFKEYLKTGKDHFLTDFKNQNLAEFNQTFSKCLLSMQRWFQDTNTLYALRMWDSWAQPEGGVLEGNVRHPGHYHECRLAVNDLFSGKWCMAYYGLVFVPSDGGVGFPIDKTMGTCFPSTCSDEAISFLYSKYFTIEEYPRLVNVICPQEPHWRTIDTICVVICAILAALCVAGTLTDYLIRQSNKSSERTDSAQSKKQKHPISIQLLLCFSVVSNGEKILDMKKHPGMLPALDGIRFISTTWVILGHTLSAIFPVVDNPFYMRRGILSDASSMAIINGVFSVDTFFFLSGLLVAYLSLKHISKQNGHLNVPLMYLQRYLRLTPLYAFIILLSTSLYQYMGTGPGYSITSGTYSYEACKDSWWTNLLYINNFYPISSTCVGVGWYLANDWQFFLLSPLFIYLLYRNRIIGLIATFLVILGSTIVNGVLTAEYGLQPMAVQTGQYLTYIFGYFVAIFNYLDSNGLFTYTYEDKFQSDTYTMPWCRIHVYMIGMLTGYILFANKGKVKMNRIVVFVGWIVSAAAALAVIYAPWIYVKDLESMPTNLAALYEALSRPAWGACLAWVAIACCSGYGGFITTFLDWRGFKPLSRLTFSVYLIHIHILFGYVYSQEGLMHYLTVNVVYTFLGTTVITFACGFIASVCVEYPFIGICKLLFTPGQPKEKAAPPSISSTEDTVTDYSCSTETEKKWPLDTPMSKLSTNVVEIEKNVFDNKGFEKSESVLKNTTQTKL